MSEWQNVRIEVEDLIAVLTIDHPPVNSFNTEVVTELNEAFDELLADDKVKAIVITGGGTNAFVAGADIPEIVERVKKPGELKQASEMGQGFMNKVENAPKPVIAAINGFCLGGGLELAMACHIRIASDRARFGQPEINLGLIPGWGGTQRLSRIAGTGKAIELILTGDMITAQEAYRLNLINKIAPAGAVLKEARGLARKIVSKSAIPVAAALHCVIDGVQQPLLEGLALEAKAFGDLDQTEDALEGLGAFLEKRQPQFKDK